MADEKDKKDKKGAPDFMNNDEPPEAPEIDSDPPPEPPAAPPEEPKENVHAITMRVASALSELGIVVQPGDDPAEFLKHVCTAIETHKATRDMNGKPDEPADATNPNTPNPAPEPQYTAMSALNKKLQAELTREKQKTAALSAVNSRLAAKAAEQEEAALSAEVDFLVRADFLDQARADEIKNLVGGAKLSLVNGGNAKIDQIKIELSTLRRTAERKLTSDQLLELKTAGYGLSVRPSPVADEREWNPQNKGGFVAPEDEAKAKEKAREMLKHFGLKK